MTSSILNLGDDGEKKNKKEKGGEKCTASYVLQMSGYCESVYIHI